jgi:hypothetical protein
MVQYLSGAAYESPELHFGGQPLTGALADEVKEMTTELNAAQPAMFLKFSLDLRKSPNNGEYAHLKHF